jgi:hypothetical protein
MRPFIEKINSRRKIHSDCGWYHPIGWGPEWNKRGKGMSWREGILSLCFLAPMM